MKATKRTDAHRPEDAAARAAWVALQKLALAQDPEHEVGSYPGPRIERDQQIKTALVGLRVRCKATLERPAPRDGMPEETHFVFMKRPSIEPATFGPERAPVKKPRKAKAGAGGSGEQVEAVAS